MVTGPNYGSCLIATAGLTLFSKRSSPRHLTKVPGTTLVVFFSSPSLHLILHVCYELRYGLSPSAGEAVTYTRQYLLTPSAGRRPRVPGAVVIIADKTSADNLTLAASSLRAAGGLKQTNQLSHCLTRELICLASAWLDVTTLYIDLRK